MPTTQEQHESELQRITEVEKRLGLFDYRLTKSEEVLVKIEESLSRLTILLEKHQVLREDLTSLEKRFEERKAKTDPVIENSQTIIGRVQGAGMVLGLLLGIIGWTAAQNITLLGVHGEILATHKSEIAVLKSDMEAHKATDDAFHQADK